MATDTERSVELARTGKARFRATNVRGGTLDFGEGEDSDFTPIELLLAAIAGCSAIDVDYLVGKRVDPESFDVSIRADKIRDDLGNRLTDIRLTFDVSSPRGLTVTGPARRCRARSPSRTTGCAPSPAR